MKYGQWRVEYPTTINGNVSDRTAFVVGSHRSGFVSLYGSGEIGIDSSLALPKGLINKLRKLSRKLSNTYMIW